MPVDYDDEQYEEVGGGDFPPTWDFELADTVKGVYLESREVNTKNGKRTIHRFQAHEATPTDGLADELPESGLFDVWGSAIINSRLETVPSGVKVKIVSTGKLVTTKNGRQAKEFHVLAAKGSIPGRA